MRLPARKLILILLVVGVSLPAALGTGLHVLMPAPVIGAADGHDHTSEPAHCQDCCCAPQPPSDGPAAAAKHDCRLCKFLAQAKLASVTTNAAASGQLLALGRLHGISRLVSNGFSLTQAARGPPIS